MKENCQKASEVYWKMKKKAITLLLACMTIAVLAGCGGDAANSKEELESTEAAASTVKSANIEYNVDDYVTLGDYKNLEITLNEADYEITDETRNTYAEEMISYTKPYIPDDSKKIVAKGDVVDVDYVGKKDGVAFDGGTAEGQLIDTATNSEVTAGSGYIDGFSDGLIGAKVGETVDWDVTFPEDYGSEELNGQTVTFTFTINSINKAVTLDNLTNEYVKEYFQVDDVEAFWGTVAIAVEEQMNNQKETDARTAIIKKLVEDSKVDTFPEGLLDARMDEYMESFRKMYCGDEMELDDFLVQNYGMTEEDFRKESMTSLEEGLKQELIFEAIAKKENIQFDETKFETYVNNIVTNGGYGSADALYELYGGDKETGKEYLKETYLQLEAYSVVAEKAKINYSAAEVTEDTTEVTENTEAAAESVEATEK